MTTPSTPPDVPSRPAGSPAADAAAAGPAAAGPAAAGPAAAGPAAAGRATDAPPPGGTGSRLTFNSPLSADRAARLVAALSAENPSTVSDLGCGWAELMLQVLAAVPSAHGTGVDVHGPDIVRARAAANNRGLADRVTLIEGSATDHEPEPADLVISLGAYQAFGTTSEAFTALRRLVTDRGRVLFAAEFWEHPPTEAELANMWDDITADDCVSLAELVDQATAAGFRPLRVETVTRGEWEEYESGHMADREIWLAAHPGHPQAETVRAQLDQQRSIWLRGHRDVMGFAYLTLLPSVPA